MAIGQFTLPAVSNLANLLAALQAGPGASLTGSSNLDPSAATGSLEDLVANQQNYSDLIKQAAVNRLQSLASTVGETSPSSVGAVLPATGLGVYTPGHGYSAAGVSPNRDSEINSLNKQLNLPTINRRTVVGPKPEKPRPPEIAPPPSGILGYLKGVLSGAK